MDKTAWGDGPWQTESDYHEWVDARTGFDCYIQRNRSGALCGYVGLPKGHEFCGAHYSEVPWRRADVHGGLTWSSGRKGLWWLGFDCAHSEDYCPRLALAPEPTHHLVYRDFAYVKAEVEKMAQQLFEPLAALAACAGG